MPKGYGRFCVWSGGYRAQRQCDERGAVTKNVCVFFCVCK